MILLSSPCNQNPNLFPPPFAYEAHTIMYGCSVCHIPFMLFDSSDKNCLCQGMNKFMYV